MVIITAVAVAAAETSNNNSKLSLFKKTSAALS
jgi:hypothetical protein